MEQKLLNRLLETHLGIERDESVADTSINHLNQTPDLTNKSRNDNQASFGEQLTSSGQKNNESAVKL